MPVLIGLLARVGLWGAGIWAAGRAASGLGEGVGEGLGSGAAEFFDREFFEVGEVSITGAHLLGAALVALVISLLRR